MACKCWECKEKDSLKSRIKELEEALNKAISIMMDLSINNRKLMTEPDWVEEIDELRSALKGIKK